MEQPYTPTREPKKINWDNITLEHIEQIGKILKHMKEAETK